MRYLALVALLLLPAAIKASDLTISQKNPRQLKLEFGNPLPSEFCKSLRAGECTNALDIRNYELYEIVEPDTEKIHASPIAISNVEVDCGLGCSLITLTVPVDLNSGTIYLVKIIALRLDPSSTDTATLRRFELSTEAKVGPSAIDASRRNEISVNATVPIKVDPANLRITREVSTIARNTQGAPDISPSPIPISAAGLGTRTSLNEITVKLSKELKEGMVYNLTVNGVTDTSSPANNINATGIIEVPGVPAPPDDPKIDLTLTSLAARHQKTVFDLVANFTPLKRISLGDPEEKSKVLNGTGGPNNLTDTQRGLASRRYSTRWAIEPSATIDVGFRSTKSNNSITLAAPFTKDFLGRRVKQYSRSDTKIPVYAGWASASLFHVAFVKFSVGPRLETDRKFQRINMLGEMRLDLNLTRLGDAGTIGGRRANLKSDLGDKAKFVEINWGFKMIPYVAFDFGGHVNNETVTNSDKNVSVLVPRHGILRTYVGAVPTFQWKAFGVLQTLSLDESVVFMARRETIGFTTDSGAELRSLRGFHPHSLIKWNIAIDPAGHYNLVTTYENGRLAPNFEYLNKTTAGFRIVY
jgi:hypothetical protein